MAWEYLKDNTFDERYKIASEFLGDLSDKVILDLNCGEPRFKKYIKYKRYIATDISEPQDKEGFYLLKDTAVDFPCDVLCLFGYGGGEYTGEPLESHTVINSFIRLAQYNPEYLIIEMVQKWQDDFKALDEFEKRLPQYKVVLERRYEKENPSHYHDKRIITIWHLQDRNISYPLICIAFSNWLAVLEAWNT